ncbi:MAG: DRTGG domain-containing protein [Saccharofermentanales bacterium]|jgi:hypothetical protein|nr:hypothetical protein [Clostridiaceae bacterium]
MPKILTVENLLAHFPCRQLNRGGDQTRQIAGGYACDLLSWVISRAGETDVWLTILNSMNVVAVASLADCACVMLTEGVAMDQAVLGKADEQNVMILSTDLTTWEAAVALAELLRLNR